MKNSSGSTAKKSTGPKKKPAQGDHVLPAKSGSDPGTSDTPKPDKSLPPQGPAPADESGGNDVGTDDKTKIDKGL